MVDGEGRESLQSEFRDRAADRHKKRATLAYTQVYTLVSWRDLGRGKLFIRKEVLQMLQIGAIAKSFDGLKGRPRLVESGFCL